MMTGTTQPLLLALLFFEDEARSVGGGGTPDPVGARFEVAVLSVGVLEGVVVEAEVAGASTAEVLVAVAPSVIGMAAPVDHNATACIGLRAWL